MSVLFHVTPTEATVKRLWESHSSRYPARPFLQQQQVTVMPIPSGSIRTLAAVRFEHHMKRQPASLSSYQLAVVVVVNGWR